MSQSPHTTDNQALLQSMLQRLKLQPGRDGQSVFQTPVSPSVAPALGQNSERGEPSLQEVDNRPLNVFSFNGNPSKEFTVPSTNNTSGFKSVEKQQASPAFEGRRSPTFFPSQKVSTDGESGEKRELGHAPKPGFSPTGTRQLFSAKPQKEVKLTFFKRTDVEKESIGRSLMTGQIAANTHTVSDMTPNQNHVPVLMSTDSGLAGGENTGFLVGNGGISSLEQSKDVQVFSSSQVTTNTRRKRSSENKTRRWTQKIKERFKDRHGNIGKKGKEDGAHEQETQVITAETPVNKPNNDAETTFFPLDCSDSSKLHPSQIEGNTTENNSSSDFDIGLGSFSLLEEIVKGQEWAKFIKPNLSITSVTERPSEEPSSQPYIQPNPYSLNQSPGSLNQVGIGSNQWSCRSTASSPGPIFSMPESAPVSNDISALKQHADQSEPMEDEQSRSEMLSRLQLRLSAFSEPLGNPCHSIGRNRIQMSRKRQHQPAERREERLQTEKMSDGEKTNKAGPLSSSSSSSIQKMEESVEPQQETVSPSHEQRSHPIPLSPTSFNIYAPPPRSVLRHSLSHDSESSMETMTKRRRVEENRRVRFCEQVITIASPDMEDTDSEVDLGADEDSFLEPDYGAVQAEIDEVLPARRSNLPAWIQALKRMNTGKKPR
ncbi:uncharacterized protein zgc:113229 isoform X1 [Girardinichthys multiradiatus]|uniref:uncharacterized protein zgc:113229 isoform X1 n=1 Tax=Girardinichthys multiradiatus TaxID=208333 RepID=UPI001FAD3CC6|nr:uncharacterized protein zgc:113229 isoform X1 [Girardinichthys multiradiatus]XP_047209127.1 uncharacterized protein zgc:113229 isoform X1 [Girardinichthys multiradiatus]